MRPARGPERGTNEEAGKTGAGRCRMVANGREMLLNSGSKRHYLAKEDALAAS